MDERDKYELERAFSELRNLYREVIQAKQDTINLLWEKVHFLQHRLNQYESLSSKAQSPIENMIENMVAQQVRS